MYMSNLEDEGTANLSPCTDCIVLLISYSLGAPEYAPGFWLGSCCSIFIFVCCVL